MVLLICISGLDTIWSVKPITGDSNVNRKVIKVTLRVRVRVRVNGESPEFSVYAIIIICCLESATRSHDL